MRARPDLVSGLETQVDPILEHLVDFGLSHNILQLKRSSGLKEKQEPFLQQVDIVHNAVDIVLHCGFASQEEKDLQPQDGNHDLEKEGLRHPV